MVKMRTFVVSSCVSLMVLSSGSAEAQLLRSGDVKVKCPASLTFERKTLTSTPGWGPALAADEKSFAVAGAISFDGSSKIAKCQYSGPQVGFFPSSWVEQSSSGGVSGCPDAASVKASVEVKPSSGWTYAGQAIVSSSSASKVNTGPASIGGKFSCNYLAGMLSTGTVVLEKSLQSSRVSNCSKSGPNELTCQVASR